MFDEALRAVSTRAVYSYLHLKFVSCVMPSGYAQHGYTCGQRNVTVSQKSQLALVEPFLAEVVALISR